MRFLGQFTVIAYIQRTLVLGSHMHAWRVKVRTPVPPRILIHQYFILKLRQKY